MVGTWHDPGGTDWTGPAGPGQGAPVQTALSVPGMHCAGCMGKVERALAAVPGVTTARANLTARSVGVTHGEAVAVPDLVAALANAGFAAQPRAVLIRRLRRCGPCWRRWRWRPLPA
jgi:Cu2+-exporting ATPase